MITCFCIRTLRVAHIATTVVTCGTRCGWQGIRAMLLLMYKGWSYLDGKDEKKRCGIHRDHSGHVWHALQLTGIIVTDTFFVAFTANMTKRCMHPSWQGIFVRAWWPTLFLCTRMHYGCGKNLVHALVTWLMLHASWQAEWRHAQSHTSRIVTLCALKATEDKVECNFNLDESAAWFHLKALSSRTNWGRMMFPCIRVPSSTIHRAGSEILPSGNGCSVQIVLQKEIFVPETDLSEVYTHWAVRIFQDLKSKHYLWTATTEGGGLSPQKNLVCWFADQTFLQAAWWVSFSHLSHPRSIKIKTVQTSWSDQFLFAVSEMGPLDSSVTPEESEEDIMYPRVSIPSVWILAHLRLLFRSGAENVWWSISWNRKLCQSGPETSWSEVYNHWADVILTLISTRGLGVHSSDQSSPPA